MNLIYHDDGTLEIDMVDYVKGMVDEFSEEVASLPVAKYPWDEKLFHADPNSPPLDKHKAEVFHRFVAKALFVIKRARPDVSLPTSFLCTRTRNPTRDDWKKLVHVMRFFKSTANETLKLGAIDLHSMYWFLDSAFALHDDMKSHTGAAATMGLGAMQNISTKQKINTRSSTESELVAGDDVLSKVVWTAHFFEAQGYKLKHHVIYRDNQATMKLEQNGKASSGKRTRHFNIKYFYMNDLIKRGIVSIEYCPTDRMAADYHTKPLMGHKFTTFWNWIMGKTPTQLGSRSVLESV
jgi:hypothetical protein